MGMSYRTALTQTAIKRLLITFGKFGLKSMHTPNNFYLAVAKIDRQLQKRRKHEQRT